MIFGVTALLALAIGVIAALSNKKDEADSVSLTEVAESCDSPNIEVEDAGKTLIIDGEGEESTGAEMVDEALALALLDIPSSVSGRMDNTRALDGMQTASWGNYEASWTYHPDEGLDVVVTEAD
jgi:hypothetical protein